MKKVCYRLALPFALALLLCVAGSCGKKEPTPQPPTPDKSDLFLSLDEKGELRSFPLPFLDFTKGKEAVEAWEKKYKSEKKEVDMQSPKGLSLIFQSLTQKELNPYRQYDIVDGKLHRCVVQIAASLIANNGSATPDEKTIALLQKEGFEKSGEENGHFLFGSEARKITIDIQFESKEFANIYYYTSPGEKPVEFVQWLELNEQGELTAVPIPFSDFSKGKNEAKEWEAHYKSELYKETQTDLFFRTNDPAGLNTARFYTFSSKGLLLAATYAIASRLIFDMNSSEAALNESFEVLLYKSGFKEVKSEKTTLYDNGTLVLSFNKSEKNPEQTLATVMPSSQTAEGKFNPNAKDFPLLLADKSLPDYEETAIDQHEEKIGRCYSEKLSKEGEVRAFIADPKTSGINLHIVKYDRKDGTYSDGSPKKAGILATSYSISGAMLEQEEVKRYITSQGFEFEKTIDLNAMKAYKYINKSAGFSMMVINSGDNFTLWHFEKLAVLPPQPNPEKKREEFYLPFFDWDTPIDEHNPIIEKEKARKFTAEVKPADPEDDIAPRPIRIDSFAPFDIEYSKEKSGVAGFTYMENKAAEKPGVVGLISMAMTATWDKNKRTLDDEKLLAFLQGEGFTLTDKKDGDTSFRTYFSSKYNVTLEMYYFMNMTLATFYPGSTDKSTIQQRMKAAMKNHINP